MLQILNISKSFNEHGKRNIILNNALMTIEKDSKVVLVGKSGCGKTTLLNIIAGLLSQDNGKIIFNNSKLSCNSSSKERSNFRFNHIGIVPQTLCLINEYTVFDNIAYPLRLRGEKQYRALHTKVKDMVVRLNIAELLAKKVSSLSAGQCQRVAIARAMITSPPILLVDELTSALDSETRYFYFVAC